MEIVITLSDHRMAVLAHKHIDVTAWANQVIQNEADRYSNGLADRLVNNALNSPSKAPMSMDRDTIITTMLNETGYKNAAEREAARLEAEAAKETNPVSPPVI